MTNIKEGTIGHPPIDAGGSQVKAQEKKHSAVLNEIDRMDYVLLRLRSLIIRISKEVEIQDDNSTCREETLLWLLDSGGVFMMNKNEFILKAIIQLEEMLF